MIIKGGDEEDVVCAAQEGLGLGAVHENPEEEEEDDHVKEEVLDVEDLELEVVHGQSQSKLFGGLKPNIKLRPILFFPFFFSFFIQC